MTAVTHHGPGIGVELIALELLVVALVAAAVGYVTAARRQRTSHAVHPPRVLVDRRPPSDERHSRRRDLDGCAVRPGDRPGREDTPWPTGRTVRWVAGIGVALAGIVGPAAVPVGDGPHDLRLHVTGHLLVGMVAPLLLVTAAPGTLALRTMPRSRARALARLLRSRPLAVVTHPAVAAVVDVGGLWLLYRTDLHAALPGALLHLHMLLAGYLFAFSLVGRDPAPHRPGLAVRAGVLVAAVAAHDVLAKLLYAAPPAGVPVAQAEFAGQLMYYGAVPMHVALFVLLGREWFAEQERVRRRAAAPVRVVTP